MFDRTLFDLAAQRVSIEDLAGRETKLKGSGNERRGRCPLCGAGEKSASPPFAVRVDRQTFRCYICDKRGDVTDLERELRGGKPVEAARRLTGGELPAPNARIPSKPKAPEGPSTGDRIAAEIWREVRPFEGSLGWAYLAKRGIDENTIARAAANLRFHANCKHHWDEDKGRWVKFPAMVIRVVVAGPDGEPVPTGGVHCTYLASGGRKADVPDAKKMWGRMTAEDGRAGGAWLIGPAGLGDLICGEGVENGLSYCDLAQRQGGVFRVAAALSLRALQGVPALDEDGVIISPVRPHPDLLAFTWPTPAVNPWAEVRIPIDRDMKGLKTKIRTGGRKPRVVDGRLEGEARARLCARLAIHHWKAAGASAARAIAPPPRSDFNDELRRVRALERKA